MKNIKPLYTIRDAKLHVSKNGNSKIGKHIASFSTLPGNEEHMLFIHRDDQLLPLTDIPGTCSHHCSTCFDGGCYARNAACRYHNTVIQAWAENTLLLRSGKLFEDLHAYLTAANKKKVTIDTFRINVSGEITSSDEVNSWNDLAIKHPEIVFSVYTKNYEALDEYLTAGKTLADNFVVNISQWHGCADAFLKKYSGVFNVFEYDDSNRKDCTMPASEIERLSKIRHCRAVDQKGHHRKDKNGEPITCDGCRYCYEKSGKTTAVWAH